eukprot:1383309-Pleurochrysis_carterae.AAC.1
MRVRSKEEIDETRCRVETHGSQAAGTLRWEHSITQRKGQGIHAQGMQAGSEQAWRGAKRYTIGKQRKRAAEWEERRLRVAISTKRHTDTSDAQGMVHRLSSTFAAARTIESQGCLHIRAATVLVPSNHLSDRPCGSTAHRHLQPASASISSTTEPGTQGLRVPEHLKHLNALTSDSGERQINRVTRQAAYLKQEGIESEEPRGYLHLWDTGTPAHPSHVNHGTFEPRQCQLERTTRAREHSRHDDLNSVSRRDERHSDVRVIRNKRPTREEPVAFDTGLLLTVSGERLGILARAKTGNRHGQRHKIDMRTQSIEEKNEKRYKVDIHGHQAAETLRQQGYLHIRAATVLVPSTHGSVSPGGSTENQHIRLAWASTSGTTEPGPRGLRMPEQRKHLNVLTPDPREFPITRVARQAAYLNRENTVLGEAR